MCPTMQIHLLADIYELRIATDIEVMGALECRFDRLTGDLGA